MPRITINGNTLDPINEAPVLQAVGLKAENASKSNYILIQSDEDLTVEQMNQLSERGVKIQEYVSEHTYLCQYEPTDLGSIESLPFVNWANVYMKNFKLAPELKSPDAASNAILDILGPPARINHLSSTPHTVDITFHADVDPNSEEVKSAVASAAHIDVNTIHVRRRHARITLQQRHLHALSDIDDIASVEKVRPMKLLNNKARDIMHVGTPVNGTVYSGSSQTVCVADTGFDVGKTDDTIHPAFQGRVKKLYALGRPGMTDDPAGHGTHVCGSVLGDGTSKTMDPVIQGTAPKASLVMQSVLDPQGGLGGLPSDLQDLFDTPYEKDNARVHTNSWGASPKPGQQFPYDARSAQIDNFVWEHPDMVICFAAGNEGGDYGRTDGVIDPRSIGSTGAAKNCITVGATESLRPQAQLQADYPTYGILMGTQQQPLREDYVADNPDGMAAFSSRGPTSEDRIKPDIVAPGTSILSARSRRAPKPADTAFGKSSDPDWFFDSGTSMATPLVAGCCAVLREFVVANGPMKNPSAALIKALLINGASELPGQYVPTEAGPSPNFNSGFGRVNMANSTLVPGPEFGYNEAGPLAQSQNYSFEVTIPKVTDVISRAAPCLSVTLVWADPPARTLQNSLNMVVVASDGTKRQGNAGFQRINNVQKVQWKYIPPGTAKVFITALRILPQKEQRFAYAWRISEEK